MNSHSVRRAASKHIKLATDDLAILDRLLYQGKNSYIHFRWWKHLQGAKNKFLRLTEFAVQASKYLENGDASAIEALYLKWVGRFVKQTQLAVAKAYRSAKQILDLESFMPFMITVMGIMARFHSLCDPLRLDLENVIQLRRLSKISIVHSHTPPKEETPTTHHTEDIGIAIDRSAPTAPAVMTKKPSSSLKSSKKRKRKNDIDDIFGSM